MKQGFAKDFLASIVVFLVALPLCMGIAMASGVPPALGLMTGIIGGLVVGFFSGAPLQVSGPAAGLSVIVYELVQAQGIEALGAIVLLGGLIQVAAAFLKTGRWFRAVAPAVIHGMLGGIGVLIFASQFHAMLDSKPVGTGIQNLLAIPGRTWELLASNSQHLHAGLVGLATIFSIVLWNRFKPARLKAIPGPLVGVMAGSLLAATWSMPINLVSIPADFFGSFSTLEPGILLAAFGNFGVWEAAIGLALIASAETLLCATAVDEMKPGHKTQYNKELMAQGLGNTLCGLVGALPMTGVIVRSSANVDAGAETRTSAILHGVWILLFVAIVPQVLAMIPMAALAGTLVFTGFKLVNLATIRELRRFSRWEVFIYTTTLVGIVTTNLLSGVMLGILASLFRLLAGVIRFDINMDTGKYTTTVRLAGTGTFLHLPRLSENLDAIPEGHLVTFETDHLSYLDHACVNLLESWHRTRGLDASEVREWVARKPKVTKTVTVAPATDKPISTYPEEAIPRMIPNPRPTPQGPELQPH